MVNFSTQIPDCDSHSSALFNFFLLTQVFVLQWLSIHWEIHIIFLSQFPLTFHQICIRMSHFIALLLTRADYDSRNDHLKDIPWEDVFRLSASVAASEFCEWVQVGIDVYIPHRSWFSAACSAATVYRNHFFCLYQQSKSSESKVKCIQASNLCRKVHEAAKLAYANKWKEFITFQKLGFWDFFWLNC